MEFSFLIVTKNRAEALEFTLEKLERMLDSSKHEICVFIDGCTATQALISKFPCVSWSSSDKSIGASPAREKLYKKAKGTILVGLDDDAHPISNRFIESISTTFKNNPNAGILAFQEVRGLFESDELALASAEKETEPHLTTDFVGCGFAIKKEAYDLISGFPKWVDIYGEESCVSIEVLDANFDLIYVPNIVVNHRIDTEKRLLSGKNYFRFEKQLKNTFNYYLVYYRFPAKRIVKLLYHNFKKYALHDFRYFSLYWKALFQVLFGFPSLLKYRKPVSKATLEKIKTLKGLRY